MSLLTKVGYLQRRKKDMSEIGFAACIPFCDHQESKRDEPTSFTCVLYCVCPFPPNPNIVFLLPSSPAIPLCKLYVSTAQCTRKLFRESVEITLRSAISTSTVSVIRHATVAPSAGEVKRESFALSPFHSLYSAKSARPPDGDWFRLASSLKRRQTHISFRTCTLAPQ